MSRGYFVLEAILYEAILSEAILYEATLSEATLYKIPLILLGDFNLNLFSCNNLNSSASNLIDTTISYGLLNVITRASRIACLETFSLIDHIYLKNLTNSLFVALGHSEMF